MIIIVAQYNPHLCLSTSWIIIIICYIFLKKLKNKMFEDEEELRIRGSSSTWHKGLLFLIFIFFWSSYLWHARASKEGELFELHLSSSITLEWVCMYIYKCSVSWWGYQLTNRTEYLGHRILVCFFFWWNRLVKLGEW